MITSVGMGRMISRRVDEFVFRAETSHTHASSYASRHPLPPLRSTLCCSGVFLLTMSVVSATVGSSREEANWGVPLTIMTAAAGFAMVRNILGGAILSVNENSSGMDRLIVVLSERFPLRLFSGEPFLSFHLIALLQCCTGKRYATANVARMLAAHKVQAFS